MSQQPAVQQSCTRFEVELEFVQCLANPYYLNYLAQSQYFENPAFIAYLEYLEYFRRPEYTKLLSYPSYSLNALSLLKQPAFRNDIINPHVAKIMADDGIAGVTALMAEQKGKGIAIGRDVEGARSSSADNTGQVIAADVANTNGRA